MNPSISKIQPGDERATNSQYPVWKHSIPLPPASLMWSVGAASIENFLIVTDAWGQLLSHFLTPDASVLDIGCGCGRTARVLATHAYVREYTGFDVIEANILWCRNFIQPKDRQFRFLHYDLYSREYNPTGALQVRDFAFPCPDRSVSVTFAASVFTHLIEPDARHYLREIARVLAPGGTALLTIHNNVPRGVRYSGTETRIDIDSGYFEEMARDAGLKAQERIDDFTGQQLFIFRR